MTATIPAKLDGITRLPRRHVATVKTYLQRDHPPEHPLGSPPSGLTVQRLGAGDAGLYRQIYATLGTRWLWWTRLMLSEAELRAVLANPATEAQAVMLDGAPIGLVELDFTNAKTPDLAFLGLYDGHLGKGYGHWLMHWALTRAWAQPIKQLTINTCTFDSPQALAFYRAKGFSVIAQAIEIVPDPRLNGLLPADAAPHVPILA